MIVSLSLKRNVTLGVKLTLHRVTEQSHNENEKYEIHVGRQYINFSTDDSSFRVIFHETLKLSEENKPY